MSNQTDNFAVEVIYALPEQQKRIQVTVAPGTTCIEAVELSDMASFFPDIDLAKVKLGIFSRAVKHHEVLQPGQRVEIYRPLIADPKDVRRKRAEKAKDEGRANKITGGRV
ncbi:MULTISPECIES: RnfH family protein [Shewanella]|uniref:RnfH family protein n=1 Tax=Shewanella TaxID=22 RepID=UPI00048F8461|nr:MULTISPECIES: RnfH family protein [Shewanella]QLE86239.1 RnfH family protein [Shewanella sp. Scap07]